MPDILLVLNLSIIHIFHPTTEAKKRVSKPPAFRHRCFNFRTSIRLDFEDQAFYVPTLGTLIIANKE